MVRWYSIGLLAALAGCGPAAPRNNCPHPCDLAQTLHVSIEGAEPAASVSASGDCSGVINCPSADGCRSVDIYLTSRAGSADAADLVCHVTAISPSGVTVERDVNARYGSSTCCSGYEFVDQYLTITF